MSTDKKMFPIQTSLRGASPHKVPKAVYMAAYEVYCKVYSPQEALITDGCRGGFGVGELVAFLYARSFPEQEWRTRVDEAFKNMQL